ncbi:response regulator transcription factor [Kitasatospora cineracea]|uniref:response regulator transcription factor n=1 Tax=Kitasatospora cineracea TaxID=88074 RepID=UPI000F4F12B7|nr:helix-turn-helix transcriptional regulator [Kitasatospora cineracea]
MSTVPPLPAPGLTDGLSRREHQVLELLTHGATYSAIARRLQLSPHTVDTYLRRIRAKTGATNRVQLALLAHDARHRAPAAAGGAAVRAH